MYKHWCQEIGNFSVQILCKLAFLECLLFHYFMINIGYNKQKIGFHHTMSMIKIFRGEGVVDGEVDGEGDSNEGCLKWGGGGH